MRRRNFIQMMAAAAASVDLLDPRALAKQKVATPPKRKTSVSIPTDGYRLICEFQRGDAHWQVYEDLRTREGSIAFLSSTGDGRELSKSAEASMAGGTPYFGLSLKEVSLSAADLLADRLLKDGDPDPDLVKSAAPPMASAEKNPRTWTTFVGTKEAYDVTPVYRSGSTRTYHPVQYAPELHKALEKGHLHDGLVGGWMPAVRKVIPVSDDAYWEVIVFGDVGPNKTKYIVHTWHRTALVEDVKLARVVYGYSYPSFPPARKDPQAEEF